MYVYPRVCFHKIDDRDPLENVLSLRTYSLYSKDKTVEILKMLVLIANSISLWRKMKFNFEFKCDSDDDEL